ncbi:MAG: hypothetical protein ABSD59_10770 [Terracidiphilus sp.]
MLRGILFAAPILILFSFGWSPSASGQTHEAGDMARPSLWAGGEISGYRVQYGERNMWGATVLVDADSAYHLGLEAEGRWLEFHQTANVHLETYMIGPRYHVSMGRFEPFVKGTVGFGNFSFSYNYASGRYLVVGAGGGVDFRLNRRWSARLAEVQYQDWPDFTFGAMNSVGVSSGIRCRIF